MRLIIKILLLIVVIALIYLGVHFASAYREIVVGEQEESSWLKDIFGFLKKDGTDPSATPDPDPYPAEEANRFDILVLGIRGDNDPDSGSLLTDTMMLLSIDTVSEKTTLISLPRDLYIDMQGIKGKINEIYVNGLQKNQGLTLTSQIVSRITGIHVDKAVLFDFKAFSEIVNTLGGVDVYLAQPFLEKTQWGYEFSLPAGNNHLNGQQALYYVRSRYSSSDFDRARRQQDVMLAIKKKATGIGFLADPRNITALLNSLKGSVRTNFELWEIKDMLSLAEKIKSSNLNSEVISTANFLYETHLSSGEYILLPKGDDFGLLREHFKTLLTL